MIAALAAALVMLSAASGGLSLPRTAVESAAVRGTETADPEQATTAPRADARDEDAELLRDLELLQRLDLLEQLELFDDERG